MSPLEEHNARLERIIATLRRAINETERRHERDQWHPGARRWDDEKERAA